jgi:hypothetical protein
MIIIAFFFLLRPGKSTDSKSDTMPFILGDVQLSVGIRQLNLTTTSDSKLHLTKLVLLLFTTQKNGAENEVINMGLINDPRVSGVNRPILLFLPTWRPT